MSARHDLILTLHIVTVFTKCPKRQNLTKIRKMSLVHIWNKYCQIYNFTKFQSLILRIYVIRDITGRSVSPDLQNCVFTNRPASCSSSAAPWRSRHERWEERHFVKNSLEISVISNGNHQVIIIINCINEISIHSIFFRTKNDESSIS